jgi:hypothetical protein
MWPDKPTPICRVMKKEVEKKIPFCDVILVPSCDAFRDYQEYESIGGALK